MIFVTVGTQDVPFDRLIKSVEKQIKNGNIKEEVIVQSGCSKYTSNKMKIINYMDDYEFKKTMKQARIVITHGGVGSIIDALNMNKVIIACPRLAKYKEHTNDHQLQIINKFSNMGYLIPLKDLSKLENALQEAEIFRPKKYKSNTENMVKLIENFIDNN